MPFAFFQMNYQKSIGPRILELCIAGIIFTALVFIGLHAFHFKVVPQDKDDPKGIKRDGSKNPSESVSRAGEPIITTPLPSQDELIRQLISANRKPQKNQPPRPLAPWEKQVREITHQTLPAEERTRRLLALAKTLGGEEQSRVYATATSVAPPAMFQQQLYPMIWNPNTPAPVARVLATGVVTQPDSFKFPALLSLLKHSDEDTRAMAESVLWAYFPDEPTNNYPQAVQRFLAGSY